MKYKYDLIMLSLIIQTLYAAQPPAKWETAKIELKHRNAQEIERLFMGSEGGLITATACWAENAIILSGPHHKLQNILAFIKTHVDVPHSGPGGRFGDHIISKN